MYGKSAVQTDCASHSCLHQQRSVGKYIIICRNVQLPFFALQPIKNLIFRIFSTWHDQGVLLYIVHCYCLFFRQLMLPPDEDPPCFLLGKPDIINYPGASTQALCSAPTSPLTALAFRSCSRKRESGVCEFVCLCFYI